ncbi:MAG: (d)CMP kinase [Planctomycetota bacterium]|jgi:cytidylate kinase|nr:(d)CMP kinase [Planctomycetota bacterium]
MIVTLDGPAGAGKSSTARELARRLGWCYMDTGAMYRAVALVATRRAIPLEDEPQLAALAESIEIRFEQGRVFVGAEDVSEAIRTADNTTATRPVADAALVRAAMKQIQRRMAADRDVVTEGRDQGSEVFPQAELKVFLTASPEERARRRLAEERAKGRNVTLDEILASQQDRDHGDTHREVGAMRQAEGAELLHTDGMDREAVLAVLLGWIEARRPPLPTAAGARLPHA